MGAVRVWRRRARVQVREGGEVAGEYEADGPPGDGVRAGTGEAAPGPPLPGELFSCDGQRFRWPETLQLFENTRPRQWEPSQYLLHH